MQCQRGGVHDQDTLHTCTKLSQNKSSISEGYINNETTKLNILNELEVK